MLLEEQSASTYENLVYSKLMIQEREAKRRQTIRDVMAASGYLSPPDEEVSIRVGIITSNFHVLRAKAIARKTGIPASPASPPNPTRCCFYTSPSGNASQILKDN